MAGKLITGLVSFVAIAQQTDEPEFSRIRAAWLADKEHARWNSVDAATVHCWNEAAGSSWR